MKWVERAERLSQLIRPNSCVSGPCSDAASFLDASSFRNVVVSYTFVAVESCVPSQECTYWVRCLVEEDSANNGNLHAHDHAAQDEHQKLSDPPFVTVVSAHGSADCGDEPVSTVALEKQLLV